MTAPLDDHAARAELVYLAADLRRTAQAAADAGQTDFAVGMIVSVMRLEATIRRWDILPRRAA